MTSDRRMSQDELILACHEMRCAWDHESPFFVTQDRTGRRVWERQQPCIRGCGSTKRVRVKADGTFQQIGQPKIVRSDGWYDVKAYFTQARRERILIQQRTVGMMTVLPEKQKQISA